MATYLMRGKRSDTSEWVTWTAEGSPDLTGADYPDGGDDVITDSTVTVVRRIDGGTAGTAPVILSLAPVASTVLTSDTVAGQVCVDPATYATAPTSLTLEAVGSVVSGVTGTLTLYDLTAGATAATLTWTETAATRKSASVTVPGSAHVYELRWKKSGGGATDYALLGGAHLRLGWS